MIPKERVMQKLTDYMSTEHSELGEYARRVMLPSHARQFEQYPFFTLAEALEKFPVLNLSHNGEAHIGMPFDDLVLFFGAHPNPIEIPTIIELRENLGCHHYRTFPIGEHSFFEDTDPRVHPDNVYYRFLEGLFGLRYGTFRSILVEAGYGLRLDRDGYAGKLMERAIAEKTPVFVDTVDTGETEEARAFIVNGFEI